MFSIKCNSHFWLFHLNLFSDVNQFFDLTIKEINENWKWKPFASSFPFVAVVVVSFLAKNILFNFSFRAKVLVFYFIFVFLFFKSRCCSDIIANSCGNSEWNFFRENFFFSSTFFFILFFFTKIDNNCRS